MKRASLRSVGGTGPSPVRSPWPGPHEEVPTPCRAHLAEHSFTREVHAVDPTRAVAAVPHRAVFARAADGGAAIRAGTTVLVE